MQIALRSALLVCLSVALTACEVEPAGGARQTDSVSLDTDDQRTLYILGSILGRDIANANLTEEEIAMVQQGLADSALRRELDVSLEQYGPMVQGFMQRRTQAAADEELVQATAFIEEQAALPGAVQTDSGLVIQEITAGTGASPTASDTVTVHYRATLRDGSVFDSTVDRGEPATLPLGQALPCWIEGLQTIRVGGESRLVCPPDLAYGTSGPPGIPGNSALVFEVELIEIVQ